MRFNIMKEFRALEQRIEMLEHSIEHLFMTKANRPLIVNTAELHPESKVKIISEDEKTNPETSAKIISEDKKTDPAI